MNPEMNGQEKAVIPEMIKVAAVTLDEDTVRAIRHGLHELANVFTGVMIAGGLLSQYLESGSLQHYATDICEGSDRGCALVREIRSRLLSACGEAEAATRSQADDSAGH